MTWLATAGGFGLDPERPEPVAFPPDALPKGILLIVIGVVAVWIWLNMASR